MSKPAFVRTILKNQEKERARIAAEKKRANLRAAGIKPAKKEKPVIYKIDPVTREIAVPRKRVLKTPRKQKAKLHSGESDPFFAELHKELDKAEKKPKPYNPYKTRRLIPLSDALK